jgi:hypothetical protein
MYRYFRIIVLFFVLFSINAHSQEKIVLLEQHTGAWCGWCVDGTVKMDEILNLYPDNVIGVKVHNGDSMVIAEQAVIASALGLTGYPTAAIDRKKFDGAVFQDRSYWKGYVETQLAVTPKVSVAVTYSLNEISRELLIKVYATMISKVTDPLRFNVFITEDSVSGIGTGWDQSNYLSNRAGYEDNPYYTQPSKIVGYQHMKVVRAMLGGAWGIQGSFTSPANAGEVFVQDFAYIVPENFKLEHLKVVGLVQVNGTLNKEVLNCAYGVKGEASIQLTSTGQSSGVKSAGVPMEKLFNLKNIASTEKTFIISLSKSQRTPSDWTVSLAGIEGNEVTLSAGEEKPITLQLTPSSTIGLGDAIMLIEVKDEPDAFKTKGNLTCISAEIERVEVINSGEDAYSLKTPLASGGYSDFIKLNNTDFNQYKDNFNLRTVVWNTGISEAITQEDAETIASLIDSKIPLFICGYQSVYGLNSAGILGLFGVKYYGYSTQGYGSSPWRVWLSGVDGDFVSGNFGSNTEGNLISYLITLLNITNSATTTPILHFSNAGKRVMSNGSTLDTFDISGEDAIIAVKVDNGDYRCALMTFSPYVIVSSTIRNELITKIVEWVDFELNDVDDAALIEPLTIKTYPNPAQEVVIIETNKPTKVSLYNSIGDILMKFDVDDYYSLDVSSLSSGVYSIMAASSKGIFTKQITIVK